MCYACLLNYALCRVLLVFSMTAIVKTNSIAM